VPSTSISSHVSLSLLNLTQCESRLISFTERRSYEAFRGLFVASLVAFSCLAKIGQYSETLSYWNAFLRLLLDAEELSCNGGVGMILNPRTA